MTLERCESVLDFAAARFSRLYPAYWSTLIFAVAVNGIAFGTAIWPAALALNLTMFQEFVGFPNIDNVYWSLTVELAFYLNAAWLLALGLHRFRQTVALGWLLASCLWSLTLHDPLAEQRSVLSLLFALDFAPYFAMGIVFFDARQHGWSTRRVALIALAVFVEFLIGSWIGAGLAILIAGIVALAVAGMLKWLVNPITLWLGTISYTLYLVHRNIGYALLNWLHAQGIAAAPAIAIAVACALGLAAAFSYAIERPGLAYLRRVYRQRRDRIRLRRANVESRSIRRAP
jgi:peptidoglycan/LPS O-acetylase OafA/YrhL